MSLLIPAREANAAGLPVRRLLPHRSCRQVGPWVFVDHFGPFTQSAEAPGSGVAPHPHCGLSTVTWLFEGAIEHRDSTGGHAVVRPGEIHWMRAGHGIAHSERPPSRPEDRRARMHGLQLWCAHPDGQEEQEPRFGSWRELPELEVDSVRVQLLAGTGWGAESPVEVTSPLVYALAHMKEGQRLVLPDHEERCVYSVQGSGAVQGETQGEHELRVADPGPATLVAHSAGIFAVLGGQAIGPRHIWWNLVHSDKGRLKEQAERWRRGEFPEVVGDEGPVIPAPPGP